MQPKGNTIEILKEEHQIRFEHLRIYLLLLLCLFHSKDTIYLENFKKEPSMLLKISIQSNFQPRSKIAIIEVVLLQLPLLGGGCYKIYC
jgi:hypothetical protein